ncbi:hypothetical protein [Mangrovimonas aestuarii]|uniref:hypothetical protein n=1 Tax=Mangrovimonas aestuarii TaxID=3018443 RepID=UPI0023791878|nr:hypothetical protein [Mangrovimonas aestuarii]
MASLKQLQDKSSQTAFDKKVLNVVQYLHPYAKHRLNVAESIGVLPKNMYSSNDVVDDCIIKLYDKGYDPECELDLIKLHLFEIVDDHINELIKKEGFHKKTISTSKILNEELKLMEEEYTMDSDMDYVMQEDLDDISYHQDNNNTTYLFSDYNQQVLQEMDISHESEETTQKIMSKFYHWLPLRVSNIVDLYIIGKLSYDDIAKIKRIETSRVENILIEIKKQFRSHVG